MTANYRYALKYLMSKGYRLMVNKTALLFENEKCCYDACIVLRNNNISLKKDIQNFCIECFNMVQSHKNHRLHAGLPF